MLRLFIGIPLPPEHRLRLSTICRGLHGVRWVDAGNLHITVRFIGEVDEGLAADIDEALATLRAARFDLAISGVATFGPPGKPRVIYAGLDREPRLFELHERAESLLNRIGLAPEGRRYSPHVTLANCKSPHPEEVRRFIEAHNLLRLPSFPVDAVHLIRSYLTKAGPLYEEVAEYGLR